VRAHLRARGPLFDGRAYTQLGRFDTDLRQAVGREATNRIVGHMVQDFRQPTPYLWTTITYADESGSTRVFGRENLPYEAWIEGTGSRNYPVTRFKGYRIFQIVTAGVPGWFDRVVRPVVAETMRRIS